MSIKKALILNIQRMSTEDGPGTRTTVLFKGCTLNCPWCHKPESMSPLREIEWHSLKCMNCNTCLNSCDKEALTMTAGGLKINRSRCTMCLKCVKACPATALEVKGKEWEVLDLYHELIKDKNYFLENGGGITLSGGEVLLQADFAVILLKSLKEAGINTAIDTCGYIGKNAIDKVFDYTDLFIYDLKLMNDDHHVDLIGQSNKLILDNFIYLAKKVKQHKDKTLWVRTPIIPDSTDSVENIMEISRFIREYAGDIIERWELCAFNNLCNEEYERLDKIWKYKDTGLIEKERMDWLRMMAIEAGTSEETVMWSGMTKISM